jgi:hypothetical protein
VQNLISWLGRIKVPSIKIPHIPGVNLGAASAPAPAAFGAFAAPRVTGVARQARAAPGGVVININGALDPEGVARQVERILGGHDRRVGRTASG